MLFCFSASSIKLDCTGGIGWYPKFYKLFLSFVGLTTFGNLICCLCLKIFGTTIKLKTDFNNVSYSVRFETKYI